MQGDGGKVLQVQPCHHIPVVAVGLICEECFSCTMLVGLLEISYDGLQSGEFAVTWLMMFFCVHRADVN